MSPRQETKVVANYSEVLEDVSVKVRTSEEFQSCLESSILACKTTSILKTAEKTGDIAYCDELSDDASRENCRFALTVTSAMKSLDAKMCEELSMPYLGNCQKQVYKMKAQKEQNISLCDMLITSTGTTLKKEERNEVQECLFAVILANTGAVSKDCDKIGDATLKRNCQITLEQRK